MNKIASHPLLAQVHADLCTQDQKGQADRRAAEMATDQLCAEQGKFLSRQYESMVAECEAKHKQRVKCSGRVNLVHSGRSSEQAGFAESLSALQTVLTIPQLTTMTTIQ